MGGGDNGGRKKPYPGKASQRREIYANVFSELSTGPRGERERRDTFTTLELGVTLKNYCEPYTCMF